MSNGKHHLFAMLLTGLLVASVSGTAFGQHAGGHGGGGGRGGEGGGGRPARAPPNQHVDGRFAHNQYYFNRGYSVNRVPGGAVGELRGRDGARYWYRGGNWYRWRGGGWVVWGAPLGLYVPFLPPAFTTVWWGGIPYYYANDTYYIWDDAQQGYEVVAPPQGIDDSGTTQAPASDQLFVYPKSGQSADQQATDRYECSRWATTQTGFDPTAAGGGVPPDQAVQKRNDFYRAQVSCLEGRNYTVK